MAWKCHRCRLWLGEGWQWPWFKVFPALRWPGWPSLSSWLKCFPLIRNYVKIGDLVDIHSWQQFSSTEHFVGGSCWKTKRMVLVRMKIKTGSKAEYLWCLQTMLVLSCSSQTKMPFWSSLVWPFQFLEYLDLVQESCKHDFSTLQCLSCDSSNNACIAIKDARSQPKWCFYLLF